MSCQAKIKNVLASVANVKSVEVSKEKSEAIIEMDTSVSLSDLEFVLPSKYKIATAMEEVQTIKNKYRLWTTYKPVLIIFSYIFFTTLIIELNSHLFDTMRWMRHFMAGFFLVFSFFKLINLKAFKESYMMYDIVAKKNPNWSYIYAFIELVLGVSYLINYNSLLTNLITLLLMSISIVGVIQSVINKKNIKCACLGGVFNLPMSTITIIEDGLMILMSLWMLILNS